MVVSPSECPKRDPMIDQIIHSLEQYIDKSLKQFQHTVMVSEFARRAGIHWPTVDSAIKGMYDRAGWDIEEDSRYPLTFSFSEKKSCGT